MLYVACDQQAAEFLLMKVNFENSLAPCLEFESRTFSTAGQHSTMSKESFSVSLLIVVVPGFLLCLFGIKIR